MEGKQVRLDIATHTSLKILSATLGKDLSATIDYLIELHDFIKNNELDTKE